MTLGISLGSNPITGVYVGSTAATAVYFGATKVWPATVSLAPKAVAYSHEPVGTTQTITFPAGAAAGDLCTIWLFASQPVPAISGWDSLYSYTWPSSNICEAIIQRELTSADITAGSLTITFGSSCVVKTVGAVWDGNNVALDVLGTASNATTGTQPLTLTAPGVTTTAKAELMAWFVAVGALGVTFSGPSGWTVEPESQTDNGLGMFVRLAYVGQDTAGATGDVSVTADDTGQPVSKSGAVLLALRQKVPTITLSATFPSNLHVGDTGSFVVTATEADGATGSLTITATGLPDGMTIGSTTDNGDGTFSATVDYDLTTEQTVTATFSATGGSVAATPLTHEFVVQAAASGGLTVVETKPLQFVNQSSYDVTLDSAVHAGDTILVAVGNANSSNHIQTVTDDAGNTYTSDANINGANGTAASCFRAVAEADAESLTLTLDNSGNLGTFLGEIKLARGASLTLDAANVVQASEVGTSATRELGPFSTSGRALVMLAVASYETATTSTLPTLVAPTDFTIESPAYANGNGCQTGSAMFDAAITDYSVKMQPPNTHNCTIARVIVPYTY